MLSAIDPTVALIVVDLQEGLRNADTAHPIAEVVQRSAEVAREFRARGLPVVLVTASGRAPGRTERGPAGGGALPPGFADVMPELEQGPSDLRVDKRTWGAFTGTDLDAQLRRHGVTQVVVTGVATTAGVESTARSAHEHGYHVVVATDAVTDRDAEAHRNSIERIFPKLAETATTSEIIEQLRRGW